MPEESASYSKLSSSCASEEVPLLSLRNPPQTTAPHTQLAVFVDDEEEEHADEEVEREFWLKTIQLSALKAIHELEAIQQVSLLSPLYPLISFL